MRWRSCLKRNERNAPSFGKRSVRWSIAFKPLEEIILRQIVLMGFDRVGDMQSWVGEFLAQRSPGDPKEESGRGLVPAGILQDARQQEPVQLPHSFLVQVAG